MATYSVRVRNLKKSVEHVVSSYESHGEKIAAHLELISESGLSKAEWLRLMVAPVKHLTHHTEHLDKLEHKYVQEQLDDPPVRVQRERDVRAGLDTLIAVERKLESVQGEEALVRLFGIPSVKPVQPDTLQKVLEAVSSALVQDKTPRADFFGEPVDTGKMGVLLRQCADALKQSLEHAGGEARELQDALMERDRALVLVGRLYQSVASILEGYYRMAGFEELAERIRPTSRRRRGEDIPTEPVEEPSLSTPAEEPAPASE